MDTGVRSKRVVRHLRTDEQVVETAHGRQIVHHVAAYRPFIEYNIMINSQSSTGVWIYMDAGARTYTLKHHHV